jgi:hypothetical protein
MKLQSEPRREKVAAILTLAGAACVSLGLAWTFCYLYFGRQELSVVFVALTGVGVLAIYCSKRSNGASLLLVAHGVLAVICAIALIDAPIAWVPRSAHLFLLPLAAGAAFTFERRERYGALFFPTGVPWRFRRIRGRRAGLACAQHLAAGGGARMGGEGEYDDFNDAAGRDLCHLPDRQRKTAQDGARVGAGRSQR